MTDEIKVVGPDSPEEIRDMMAQGVANRMAGFSRLIYQESLDQQLAGILTDGCLAQLNRLNHGLPEQSATDIIEDMLPHHAAPIPA
jgi:hypothetical protein